MIFNYLMNWKYSREIKEAEDEFHKMILGKIKNEQIRHLDKNGGILFEGEMMGVIDEVFDPWKLMDPRNIQRWTNGFNIVMNGKEIRDDRIF